MRGRFAPSPTGVLHLGNLRTALLAWLFARSAGSAFVVRVEDLDTRARAAGAGASEQLADLAAIGLDWDGPVWVQSERAAHYEAALASLPVYECFCTRAEIRESASAAHGPVGAYPGTCRALTDGRARRSGGRRARAGAAGAAGRRRSSTFEDRVLGPQAGVVDDFVVRRNDGAFAYNLAVVVDDAAQGIEEVVRGADLRGLDPAADLARAGAGLRRAGVRPRAAGARRRGRRLAKRDGDVTLREVARLKRFSGWRGRSVWPARRRASCSRVRPGADSARAHDLGSDRDAPTE